ncbi:MAG: UDP-2,4-diacetamido-2,4,6-trideoxy-beta-L-altropyranose hydrolase [Lachnospiraceae bacterium]|nr:UDP-2,4-diacetamido-2,4,6-trideoxy-beta-L-altropyranose hydrolase [Lachnospiraceae bacterium]
MGTDRLVYFRTDGNSSIATGHLIRCLSIAQACHDLGLDVCFLVSDHESKNLLEAFLPDISEKPDIQVLKTAAYNDLEKELTEVTALISDANVIYKKVIFFLDSYFVTEKYLNTIRSLTKTAYLDDLQLFDYPADLVINYDVIPDDLLPAYRKAYTAAGKRLLGASYTPLRKQFHGKEYFVRRKASNVLVTTGGSDPFHFCLRLIEAFHEKLQLHIVIGKLNEDREALYCLAASLPFITLHENVSDMASLMAKCDLAVSAAGTTLYELCAVGVPAVSFTMADNQITAAKAFADTGTIPYAGDLRDSFDTVLSTAIDFLACMSENKDKRKSAHENMHRLVDGKGAMRIAEEL